MGWGRTLLLGDIGNRLDIEDVEREVASLRRKLMDANFENLPREERLNQLEADNTELKLYLSATIRLLLSKGVIGQAELKKIVDEVDASDGNQDGAYSGPVIS